jgi:vacuolar-type H+-ATPase catalytic subunit A/Vma1
MEEASNSESSHTSSLSKFFDKDMLKEFSTMRDLLQEMLEDRKESTIL